MKSQGCLADLVFTHCIDQPTMKVKLKSRLQVVQLANQLSDLPLPCQLPNLGLWSMRSCAFLSSLDSELVSYSCMFIARASSLIITFYCVYNCIPEALQHTYNNTVIPVLNDHAWAKKKWSLKRGGLLIEVKMHCKATIGT